ncbi:MAG: hypothetical protein LAO77_16210, partial [Acidobacteriia bacterium]|nr:hypothetical protein [Terriglobia bacterium]
CVLLQDVAHPGEGLHVPPPRQRPGRGQLIVGFEVSINCRFWVSTEVVKLKILSGALPRLLLPIFLLFVVDPVHAEIIAYRPLSSEQKAKV